MRLRQKIGWWLGPLLFLLLQLLPITLLDERADKVVALALWMLAWWITEAVSLSVTALLPLIVLPLLGVLPMGEVGASYGSPIVFLFFGGFVLALALEKVNLHRRIALVIIKATGTTPNRIVLGFMLATALLSMWISNTASTVVMLPIALSVLELLDKDTGESHPNLALSIMLGIAFAANAGGMATIIGTPPNTVMVGMLKEEYNIEVSFLNWMLLGLPFAALLVGLVYWIIVRRLYPIPRVESETPAEVIDEEIQALGSVRIEEKWVLGIFLTMVLLWVLRVPIDRGLPFLEINDTLISLMGAIALFALPYRVRKWKFVLQWGDTHKLSWGILILFGGGLALARAMSEVGIIDKIAGFIEQSHLPPLATAIVLIVLMLGLTELMSNVALVNVLAPVFAGIAQGLDIPLLRLLIPVTLAASCAFMLPMATPPNAIVFASGHIRIPQMVRAGIWLNLSSIILLVLLFQWVLPAAGM